jgi:site-specific DNA-cytosine methylase
MITCCDLCPGHGGTAEGFVQAGNYESRGAFDIDKYALKFHKLNHPGTPTYQCDLLEVNSNWILRKVGAVNTLVITAPCQGISAASSKCDLNHPLNRLLIRCIQMIPLLNPDVVIIENVSGITKGEMRRFYHIVLGHLRSMKAYRFTDGILNALDFGVPQDRNRWICVMLKREIGIPTLPPIIPRTDQLKIRNVDTSLQFIKGGYHEGNGIYHKVIRSYNEYCFTLTATVNAFNEHDTPLTIDQVRKFCGYRNTWIYDPDHFRLAWKLFGNSVMPGMSHSIAMHIKKLLGVSDTVGNLPTIVSSGQTLLR